MSKIDWKETIKSIAPTIGTILGGPLTGTAIKVLGDAMFPGQDKPASEMERQIETAVTAGLSPDTLAALKKADADFKVRMRELDLEEDKLYVQDTAHARQSHAGDKNIFWLGVCVQITFLLIMAASMYGSYKLLTNGFGEDVDAGIVAAVFGLIGTINGYVAANAQQVTAYFFGSSSGSKQKTDAIGEAMARLSKK